MKLKFSPEAEKVLIHEVRSRLGKKQSVDVSKALNKRASSMSRAEHLKFHFLKQQFEGKGIPTLGLAVGLAHRIWKNLKK